jgi:type I restriction enzyme S subunit
MNQDIVIDNISVITESPNGLILIREAIMEMAISGKLSASSKTLMKDNQSLPSDWEVKKFSDIVNFSIGKTPPTKDAKFWGGLDSIMWVSIGDMVDGDRVLETNRRVSPIAQTEIFRKPPWPSGTLLMSFKLTIGKMSRLGAPAFFNEAIFSFDSGSEITNEYLFRVLPIISSRANSKGAIKGNTLNSESIREMKIPLPPIEEQKRLVDIIDEMYSICDELAKALDLKQKISENFARSAVLS